MTDFKISDDLTDIYFKIKESDVPPYNYMVCSVNVHLYYLPLFLLLLNYIITLCSLESVATSLQS